MVTGGDVAVVTRSIYHPARQHRDARSEPMGCGCKGGTWTPPAEQGAEAKPGQEKLPPAKNQGAVGPAAPGYFHGPDRP